MDQHSPPDGLGYAVDIAAGSAVIGWLILEAGKIGTVLMGIALFASVMLHLYARYLRVKRERLILKGVENGLARRADDLAMAARARDDERAGRG